MSSTDDVLSIVQHLEQTVKRAEKYRDLGVPVDEAMLRAFNEVYSEAQENSNMISQLSKHNDLFRQTMLESPRHRVVLTAGVMDDQNREAVITAVRTFCDFDESNDPYGLHDFGAIQIGESRYFWKIDFYDLQFEFGADPLEGEVARVLTIMRADEY